MMLSHRAGDGGNKAWSPGRARISRKTTAQGRPVVRLVPVVLPRAFLLHADHGCGVHPVFPAPSVWKRDVELEKLGWFMPREREGVSPVSLRAVFRDARKRAPQDEVIMRGTTPDPHGEEVRSTV